MSEYLSSYPYEEGQFGIPFVEIFSRINNGKNGDEIVGGSGRRLCYRLSRGRRLLNFQVFDLDDLYYALESTLDMSDSVIGFSLNTKIKPSDIQFGIGQTRHPDLFARKFIGVALEFFENLGYRINCCKAYWVNEEMEEYADNYHSFMNAFRRTGNKAESARLTWTGRALAEYGFTAITDDDVHIIQDPNDNEVYAYFRK